MAVDERVKNAEARPVIVPDTIAIDHGSVFGFRSACLKLGISWCAGRGLPTGTPGRP